MIKLVAGIGKAIFKKASPSPEARGNFVDLPTSNPVPKFRRFRLVVP